MKLALFTLPRYKLANELPVFAFCTDPVGRPLDGEIVGTYKAVCALLYPNCSGCVPVEYWNSFSSSHSLVKPRVNECLSWTHCALSSKVK